METKSLQEYAIRIKSNRQTANSNLPCRPLVTHKDTRPRFCNPSSLNSHFLISSLTPAHVSGHCCTSKGTNMHSHNCVETASYHCTTTNKQGGRYLSPSPTQAKALFFCLYSCVLFTMISISLTPPSWPYATFPLHTCHWPLFPSTVKPRAQPPSCSLEQ